MGTSFFFTRCCLQAPRRGGRCRNLANLINQAVANEIDVTSTSPPTRPRHSELDTLAARVSSKLEDGDFRGAVQLASFRDTFCVPDETSLDALQKKTSNLSS